MAFDIMFISCLFLCSVSEQSRLARNKSLKMMFFSMCGGCCEEGGMYVLFERGFWWSCVVILLRPREISVSRKTWFCRPIFTVSSRGS